MSAVAAPPIPRHCPFCGRADSVFVREKPRGAGPWWRKIYQVTCSACLMTGEVDFVWGRRGA